MQSCSQRLAIGLHLLAASKPQLPCPGLPSCRTTLPLKKGLSSSAAVCVLVARAFNQAYGLRLTTRGEMQYAYEGERMTPSQVGTCCCWWWRCCTKGRFLRWWQCCSVKGSA